eukprot:TRINITY_DN683_c0_g1_i1.p3 TRINITY_DN683_c0_g1~~TRINITY_DN683_c0_g1_i1.p3  ORF type:complete len:158 (+),score=43.18 TRINITY_DN683_c0_g1_i1:1127-1600(+)
MTPLAATAAAARARTRAAAAARRARAPVATAPCPSTTPAAAAAAAASSSSSASSADLRVSYWDTVLSQPAPSHGAQQPPRACAREPPPPSPPAASSAPLDSSRQRSHGVATSIFRRRSGSLGLVTEPIADSRRNSAARPFGCHLCKGRFERIGHLNV